MRLRVLNIQDVAQYQLCCGCGACAAAEPERIEMIDVLDHGRRPRFIDSHADDEREAPSMRVCPGVEQAHDFDRADPALMRELLSSWGPIRELWEGHAADPRVRHTASSGGAASALALYCIEQAGMHGVLHTAAREDAPYLNRTVLSTTREEVIAAAGSRYAPASPCDGLRRVEGAPAPCVFIGKPCDVIGAQRLRRLRPALDERLGLTIGFFCAGTPTTRGTLEMLRRMGVERPETLKSLRYRGDGWPGRARAVFEIDGRLEERTLRYEESWGEVLSKHKQWRCNLCPDRTGEFADIAVGDPWYGGIPDDAPGRSLILARTERGRDILRGAMEAGYILAAPAESWKLPASQVGFPELRGAIWGRLLALRLLGVPTPRYAGFSMLAHWCRRLSLGERARSVLGAVRRVRTRGISRRARMTPLRVGERGEGAATEVGHGADA